MRAHFLIGVLTLLAASASAAEAPNARAAYVERRGLLEADARCQLFAHDMRTALNASAGQARGALLRAGWSRTQVGELEQTVVAAAGARACNDVRTQSAAADARAAFGTWLRANSVTFEGWARAWETRRVAGSDGWRLRQAMDAPIRAQFGVRAARGADRLVLVVPVARRAAPPAVASLSARNPRTSAAPEISLQQRMTQGLEAGAPAPGAVTLTFAATRSIERLERGANQAVFTFPDAAFGALLALDPRETIVVTVQERTVSRRILIEVGDIAAARDFLTIGGN